MTRGLVPMATENDGALAPTAWGAASGPPGPTPMPKDILSWSTAAPTLALAVSHAVLAAERSFASGPLAARKTSPTALAILVDRQESWAVPLAVAHALLAAVTAPCALS